MPVHLSGISTSGLNIDTEQANPQEGKSSVTPVELSPTYSSSSAGSHETPPESPSEKFTPTTESLGDNLAAIDQSPINTVLRGEPFSNPTTLDAGPLLHAALKKENNLETGSEEDLSKKGSKGPLGRAAANVLNKGAVLARSVNLRPSRPAQQKSTPQEVDEHQRRLELHSRAKKLMGSEPAMIHEKPINRGLTGEPSDNPGKVDSTYLLHTSLKESADSEEGLSHRGSKGPLGRAAANVLNKGAVLARSVNLRPSRPPQQRLTPQQIDEKRRQDAMTSRARELMALQDDPEERQKLRDKSGINRLKKDGTWD